MKFKYLFAPVMMFITGITSMPCYAQAKTFVLRGETKTPDLDSVSIQYIDAEGKIIQETVPAVGGNFSISGSITEPSFSYLLFKRKGEQINKKEAELKRHLAYLVPGKMTIANVPRPGEYLAISGSKPQEEYKDFLDKTRGLKGQELNKATYAYFISHTNSYVTAERIKYFTSVFSTDSIQAVYHKYNSALKNSTDGRRLAAELKSRVAGKPGSKAFAFDIRDKNGKALRLENLRGKYVLIDFWATWCVPCRASMPHMIKLYQQYKDKNFEMIGIADDDRNVNNWIAAIAKDGTDMWPQALRGLDTKLFIKGIDNPRDISQQYGVRALPTKVLIDPDGKIIGRYDGQHQSDADLDKLLESLFK